MIALLERERKGGSLRPTLTLEPCTNAWTLVIGLRCRRSVGRSVALGVASSNVSATVSITTHQSPVDPADHDTEGDGFGCSAEGYYPTSLFCTPRSYRCLSVTLSSLIGLPPFYGYPSRGLNHHCALSSLSPATHTMGGNRLLRRGNVLERLPELGLN